MDAIDGTSVIFDIALFPFLRQIEGRNNSIRKAICSSHVG